MGLQLLVIVLRQYVPPVIGAIVFYVFQFNYVKSIVFNWICVDIFDNDYCMNNNSFFDYFWALFSARVLAFSFYVVLSEL